MPCRSFYRSQVMQVNCVLLLSAVTQCMSDLVHPHTSFGQIGPRLAVLSENIIRIELPLPLLLHGRSGWHIKPCYSDPVYVYPSPS